MASLKLLHLYLALPLGVTLLEFLLDVFWHQKTTVIGLSYGVLCVIPHLAIFVQYRHVTDGQMDIHMMTAYTALP